MNLSKSYEYFQPEKVKGKVHIIGCGSVGSTVAENLARCGIKNFVLWDFDTVESHNVSNQMFTEEDVGEPKTTALAKLLFKINPEIKSSLVLRNQGWSGQALSGYIFMCVDSIDIRRKIVSEHMNSPNVKAIFDFRTSLESAQHYAADWSDKKMKESLWKSMQFTEEEAAKETPTSACGITLGVVTTVRNICSWGVNNFINFVNGKKMAKMVVSDAFHFVVEAFY